MPEQRVKPKLTQTQIELETRDKRRLETFIDGVFAIAITLLGLQFVVPLAQHSNEALLASLVGIVPKFIGYFLAFALLGILLNNNWRQFQNIAYANWVLYLINVLFLSFVVLSHSRRRYGLTTPTPPPACCSSTVSCSSRGSFSTRTGRTLNGVSPFSKGITAQTLRVIMYRNASLPVASALAIALAFISPQLSSVAYVLVAEIMGMASRHARSRHL